MITLYRFLLWPRTPRRLPARSCQPRTILLFPLTLLSGPSESGGQLRIRSFSEQAHRSVPVFHRPKDASGNGNGTSSSRTIPVWRTNFQNCPFPACSAGYSIGSTSKGYTQKRARPESTVFTSVSAFPSQMIGALTFRRRCAGAAVYRLPVAIPSRAGRPHSFRLDHEFRRASRSRRTPSATTSKHLLKERPSARTSCAMRTELSSG
jgi:hypothetical protein